MQNGLEAERQKKIFRVFRLVAGFNCTLSKLQKRDTLFLFKQISRMNELIKVSKSESGKDVVSAREVYDFLGYDKSQWARWYKMNILENTFCIEGEDWIGFDIVSSSNNGIPTKDFAISLDFAKRLAMMAKTQKGEEARTYFIECERQLKESQLPSLPKSYSEALRELADKNDIVEKQNEQLLIQAPKVEFYDAVTQSKDTIDMAGVAKVLNLGIGRNNLFELLRNKKVLQYNNQPYQKYVDLGWFRIIESKFNKPDGSINISLKTVVFQKGVEGIAKIIVDYSNEN